MSRGAGYARSLLAGLAGVQLRGAGEGVNVLSTRARRLGTVAAASYAVVCLLVLLPCYNWFYRVGVSFLHLVALAASLGIVVFVLIPLHVRGRHPKRALMTLILGSLILFAGLQVNDWRYTLTQFYVERICCASGGAVNEDEILGGIRAIRVDGAWTGAFENTSHCLGVPCVEEFYYCSDARVGIGP
jgi:hypothetical protein